MTNDAGAMASDSESRFSRLLNAMFPRMPDFHRLLNDQCSLVVRGMDVFDAFLETGDAAKAKEVRWLENEDDKLKARNIDVPNRSFSTPFDRGDIYRATTAIDEGLNYAKTTVREMEVLGVEPDRHRLELARFHYQGAKALQAGFMKVKTDPPARGPPRQFSQTVEDWSYRQGRDQTRDDYSVARSEIFPHTHKAITPWHVVWADDKKQARLNVIRHLMSLVECPDKDKQAAKQDPEIVFTYDDRHLKNGASAQRSAIARQSCCLVCSFSGQSSTLSGRRRSGPDIYSFRWLRPCLDQRVEGQSEIPVFSDRHALPRRSNAAEIHAHRRTPQQWRQPRPPR